MASLAAAKKKKPEPFDAPSGVDVIRSSLLCYVRFFWPGYVIAPHHVAIAEHLEALEQGIIDRLIINIPPRHGKTCLAAEFFPAYYLGRNPSKEIIFTTYSQDKADDVGPKVRDQLIDEGFRALFPTCVPSGEGKRLSGRKFTTTMGGGYKAVGRGGAITGRGAHLFIIDDPIKDRMEADSPGIRKKIKDWYRSVVYTRLRQHAAILLIQTRWHEDDLAGWLLREQPSRWTHLSIPAICHSENDPLGREIGEGLWEDDENGYPLSVLKEIKETTQTREWSALYQQEPILAEDAMVQLSWFRRYEWTDRKKIRIIPLAGADDQQRPTYKIHSIIQSWDTSFKKTEGASPSACTTWGLFKIGGRWSSRKTRTCYALLDVFSRKMEYPELKRMVYTMWDRWRADAVLIEDKASGQSLLQELRTKPVPAIPIQPEGDKVLRMSVTSPEIEAGKVFLPETESWLTDYEVEIAMFPFHRLKDSVDSTSQFLRWISKKKFRPRAPKNRFWK